MQLAVTAVTTVPGPLFEHVTDEGDVLLLYHVATEAETADGRRWLHTFQPFGRGADGKAQRFAERVRAAGVIDTRHWHEAQPASCLEERLGAFGEQWQHEWNERHAA